MSDLPEDLSALGYAAFALEQPLTLDEIRAGAATRSFPALATQTPDWFAAAALGSDLLAMAPELREVPADESARERDLIGVYAPEMAALEELDDDDAHDAALAPPPVTRPDQRASASISLLQELSDLDD